VAYNESMAKSKRIIQIRFDGEFLYEYRDGIEKCLGNLRVSNSGYLTQEQKLAAVANKNHWVVIRGKTIDRKSLIDFSKEVS